jgi:signal transduction histidine kinase
MIRSRWSLVVATLFLASLAWYLLYTERLVGALREDAATLTRIYAEVQAGLADTTSGGAIGALVELQRLIIEAGIPLVVTGPGDTVIAFENLPFEVDAGTPQGQARLRGYVRQMDARQPPVGDPSLMSLHFGDPPELRRLRWIPWLQAGGLALTVLIGLSVIRVQRRAESERAWTSMARELAHQLGTPLSSLQGWLEVLKLPDPERPGGVADAEIAREIEEDLVRLERVSRRFELIGREPPLTSLSLSGVIRELERYIQARIPRLGRGAELRVELAEDLPLIQGNEVLLTWALENVVKNALDALAGRGGRITIEAERNEPEWIVLRIRDTGPGVDPAVRERVFEPGVSTKASGWGVGLALTRRIVEGVHRGRIELLDGWGEGTTIQVKLPVSEG